MEEFRARVVSRLLCNAALMLGIAALGGGSAAAGADGSARPADTDWPAYAGDMQSTHYTPLAQIGPTNVARLRPVCRAYLGDDGRFETGPLVIGGVMYVTTASTTLALDAATCSLRWRSIYKREQPYVSRVNRGAAYLAGALFRGTADCRLIALDAATGATRWKIKPCDPRRGEFLSSAPLAWKGLVFIGVAGADWGVKGRMMAFEATSGKRMWTFDTIPTGRQRGADSWRSIPAALSGGGSTWSSYSLDEATGSLFVPVGNPAPDFAPHLRPGNDLFTNSIVVLDARTGRLSWWYQLVPHDSHDYDAAAAPALVTNARGRLMAAAGKDGYLHVVDRTTHRLLFKIAVTRHLNDTADPTVKGVMTCPGPLGGVEWNGAASSARGDVFYVGAVDWCGVFRLGDARHAMGEPYYAGEWVPRGTATGWLTAVDALSGRVRWKVRSGAPIVGGVTATRSGLVFAGDLAGTFSAFDGVTGKRLYRDASANAIAGGIVSYAVGGTQYVAVASGNKTKVTFESDGTPAITVYALDAKSTRVVDLRTAIPK